MQVEAIGKRFRHVDLTTGNMVVTGKEFAFHVPGDGIVFGQDGRLTSAADGRSSRSAGGRC